MYVMNQYMGYVKKEDAKEILGKQQMMGWVLAAALGIVYFIMQTMVGPKVISLYHEFGRVLPWYAETAPRTAVFVVTAIILLVVRPQSDAEIDQKLRHYKTGEMILMNKLTDTRYVYTTFGVMFVSIMFIILSIVLPIYDITSGI